MKTFMTLAVLLLSSAAFAGSAPLPDNRKAAIYWGWDTLRATTEDIYRHRHLFAETGFTGIGMPITGCRNGKAFRGKIPIDGDGLGRWDYADFAKALPLLREMLRTDGLRDSYALVYFMSFARRLPWDDDAGWAVLCHNFAMLGRVAKDSGMKGIFVDHEDYTRKPLFIWREGDPDYDTTCRLARRRGRELIAALATTFPEARLVWDLVMGQHNDALWSQVPREGARARRDLWYPFVNGMLEAMPPEMRLKDGAESTYGAKDDNGYRARGFLERKTALALIEPALRDRFHEQVSPCYAKYLDPHVREPVDPAAFARTFLAAGRQTDEMYWTYGEKHAIVRWDRPPDPSVTNTTWREIIPDMARILRVSEGDYSEVRALAARGDLKTVIKVSDPVCIRGEKDWFTRKDGKVRPGDRVYVRFRAKGREPQAEIVWLRKGNWDWSAENQTLVRPCEVRPDGWKVFEVCRVVPDGIDGIGFVLGARDVSPEDPCRFDDIGVYFW